MDQKWFKMLQTISHANKCYYYYLSIQSILFPEKYENINYFQQWKLNVLKFQINITEISEGSLKL